MSLEKITIESSPSSRRSYDDACGMAHGLDLIGERWALHVIRELMLGPKRFSDLRADLPGISANVLTQRLEGLEVAGILFRWKLPPPASSQVYELTAWGYESETIVKELGRWATRSPGHDPTLPLSGTSLMLSFRTMFDAGRAGKLNARVGLRIGAESFLVRISGGLIEATRVDVLERADVTFTGAAPAIAAAIYGGQPLAALKAEGALSIEGDRKLAERFLTLFQLPPKAERPATETARSRQQIPL